MFNTTELGERLTAVERIIANEYKKLSDEAAKQAEDDLAALRHKFASPEEKAAREAEAKKLAEKA